LGHPWKSFPEEASKIPTAEKNDFSLSERPFGLNNPSSNQHRKEAKFTMTITKIAAVVALAAATLTLGACASKQAPAPATVGKSK
jgi:hypothetical protein